MIVSRQSFKWNEFSCPKHLDNFEWRESHFLLLDQRVITIWFNQKQKQKNVTDRENVGVQIRYLDIIPE